MKMGRHEAKARHYLAKSEVKAEELGYCGDQSCAHKYVNTKSSEKDCYVRGGACLHNVQIGLLSSLCWLHAGQVCTLP